MSTRIIIEGPDLSGKTHLANQLMIDFPEAEYRKSPAGARSDWDEAWSYWHTLPSTQNMVVMDRIPIIAETVYGSTIRDIPRVQNSLSKINKLAALFNWPAWLYIACEPTDYMIGEHVDPMGHRITQADHDRVAGGYKVVTQLLKSAGASVFYWDYQDNPHLLYVKLVDKIQTMNKEKYNPW